MTYWTPPDPTQMQYPEYQPPRRSRRRRRLLWAGLAAVVAAAGIAAGVLVATSGSSSDASATQAAPAATKATNPPAKARARVGVRSVRGSIESQQGSAWTLKTAQGTTVTVTITPNTKWGTQASPGSESQFVTGDRVVVRVVRSKGSMIARRVIAAPATAG